MPDQADYPDFGRDVLYRHLFPSRNEPAEIQPGVFLARAGEPFRYRPAPEGDRRYCAVALDQPRQPQADQPGIMRAADLPPLEPHTVGVGSMGECVMIDRNAPPIEHDRAKRTWHLAQVLERLLERFHADPRHEQTGFLTDRLEDVRILRSDRLPGGEVVWCVHEPYNAQRVVSEAGCVYSSHQRWPNHPLEDPWFPQGYAGNLTLVGQITCIAAVLRGRLGALLREAPSHAERSAITQVAGRTKHPIDWTVEQRATLEQVRGELWQWAIVPPVPDGEGTEESSRDTEQPPAELPALRPHDRQAWQLSLLHGVTQQAIADKLNEEHGTTYTQGQVSRMINRAKRHADASGLADKVPKPTDRERSLDPTKLNLGRRIDKRAPRPSDLARAEEDAE
jgi:hypothetical protein